MGGNYGGELVGYGAVDADYALAEETGVDIVCSFTSGGGLKNLSRGGVGGEVGRGK